jgi:hypothetical protein
MCYNSIRRGNKRASSKKRTGVQKMRRVSGRQAGAAAARQSLRAFDREMRQLDQAAKVANVPPTVEEQPVELVQRPEEVKTFQFEMNGKTYRTRSSWELFD